MKKSFLKVFLLAIMACGLFLVAGVHVVKAGSKTITVPDDFATIQAAVDNATAGDTVFVKKGTYSAVFIDKSLSLIGEDRSSTIIMGKRVGYGSPPPVIEIWRDTPNVTISGFTLGYTLTGNDNGGIWIDEGSYNCTVKGNIITGNEDGIVTFGLGAPANILISDNYITNNTDYGVSCGTPNTTISGNTITGNGWSGITIDSSFDVTVSGNTIKGNGLSGSSGFPDLNGGLNLDNQGPFDVYGNDIIGNQGYGVQFGVGCNNATVHENNIERNLVGVEVLNYFVVGENPTFGKGNLVYLNNLVNNSEQVVIEKQQSSPNQNNYTNGTDTVSWDNEKGGNYWSDYATKYPNASGVGNSGIGNTPYVVDSSNIDHYPLTKTVSVPEFPSWIILPLFTVISVLIAVGYRRRKLSS
jgi:parallel beta-helix repeat protein